MRIILIAILMTAGCIWLMSVAGKRIPDGPATSVPASATLTEPAAETIRLSQDSICAKSQDDLYRVVSGSVQGDTAGVAALLRRGDAMVLKAGTQVDVMRRERKLAKIWIGSGVHYKETCWAAGETVK